jgi:ABC-type sugar transport system permease subunit
MTPPLAAQLGATPPLPARPAWQTPVGLVLVLPAFVLLVVSYIWPTISTVLSSFQHVKLLPGSSSGSSSGFTTRNYSAAFDGHLGGDFGFALSLAIVPILVVLVAAPVLAWTSHQGGTVARWVTRGLLALPLAAYAPTAIALALFVSSSNAERGTDDFGGYVRAVYWWGTFGLAAALASTLFLATLRRRDPHRRPWPALAVAAGIALAATIAAALQEFTYPFVLGAGSERASTPATDLYRTGFMVFDLGRAYAVSTLLLAVLIVLGLGATFAVVLSGLRLEFDGGYRSADQPAGWPASRIAGVVIGGVALLVVIILSLIGIGPLLGRLFSGGGSAPPGVSAATIQVNTWLPTLLSSVVGVVAAAVAAFGIGWLRPLGRRSTWLLLPFGLFLFVGVTPLGLHAYAVEQAAGGLNTVFSLIPPSWVAVPALFVLTLLFQGQALRVEALRQERRTVSVARQFVPVLPMVALAFLATWVVQAQDLFWPLISVSDPQHMTGPVALLATSRDLFVHPDAIPFGVALPATVFVFFFLLAAAAQLFYLDRVALRVGSPERDGPQPTAHDLEPAAHLP